VIRLGVVVLLLVACSVSTSTSPPTPAPSHQAADLRVRLSLLFGENVLIIAKQSEAAAEHSDEYSGYLGLLATNADDLRSEVELAFGNTAADEFFALWTGRNVNTVEYAIDVVTHNQDKSNQALTSLGDSDAKLAEFFDSRLQLTTGTLGERFNAEIAPMKEFVGDTVGQNYALMYREIDIAYLDGVGIGDVVAPLIAKQFPDKFPGDLSNQSANERSLMNVRLQERAYLLTMATDARIKGREVESQAVASMLTANANAMARFKDTWAKEVTSADAYASDASASAGLTQDFVSQLSTAAAVPWNVVAHQVDAMAKVIDDQRAKSYKALAGDDRASATAMQPLADAIATSSVKS